MGNSRDLCKRETFSEFFLKRDEILWVFGKGVKFPGFWERGKILGLSGKGGGGQFSVLFLKMGYSGYFLQNGEILDSFAEGGKSSIIL